LLSKSIEAEVENSYKTLKQSKCPTLTKKVWCLRYSEIDDDDDDDDDVMVLQCH
jgi:hypothetical protein